MNRVRLAMLAGILSVGGSVLGTSSAQAQYIGGNTDTAPRYSTSSGGYYYGGGSPYYAPQPAPSYYAPRYSAPAPTYRVPARSMNRGGGYPHNPSGRHDGLARPWLQPLR